jgi:hypothetical protein
MWLLKFSFFIVIFVNKCSFGDIIDSEVINAIPLEVNTEPEVLIDKERAENVAVRYNGAQLWRISYQNQEYKNVVAELQKNYQAVMWNLQMANVSNSYVDLFLKSSVVEEAKEFMTTSNTPYEVVINDVQDAIDTENPPLDEIDLWQNRDGKK